MRKSFARFGVLAIIIAYISALSLIDVYANPRIRINRERVIIREKVVNYGELLKVIAVPVTETNAEYYFEKASKVHISDEDAKKIAEFVIKLLEEKLADETSPDNPTESQVVELVNNRCLDCHNNDKRGGDLSFVGLDGTLTLSNTDNTLTEGEIATLMYLAAFDGSMPKGGTKLTDEEVALLQKFAKDRIKYRRQSDTNVE
jgi:hypothetical protein